MKTFTEYSRVDLDIGRATALADLISACKEQGVEVSRILYTMNGYIVFFKGIDGDAALHDGTYGRFDNEWETYKMPWDYGDVSMHDTETLAKLLGALKRGEDWKQVKEDEEDEEDDEDEEDVISFNFISDYNKLTALLKLQAARNMEKEDELHGG